MAEVTRGEGVPNAPRTARSDPPGNDAQPEAGGGSAPPHTGDGPDGTASAGAALAAGVADAAQREGAAGAPPPGGAETTIAAASAAAAAPSRDADPRLTAAIVACALFMQNLDGSADQICTRNNPVHSVGPDT